MDYTAAALLFTLGFVAAYLAGRGSRWGRDRGGLSKLPLEGGAVRLDLMAQRSHKSNRGEGGVGNGKGSAGETPTAGLEVVVPVEKGTRKKPRDRRRK